MVTLARQRCQPANPKCGTFRNVKGTRREEKDTSESRSLGFTVLVDPRADPNYARLIFKLGSSMFDEGQSISFIGSKAR